MDFLRVMLLTIWISQGSSVEYYEGCSSPQYLQFGSMGIIECSFSEGYYGILWYNSTDIEFLDPVVELIESVKSGKGYTSEDYDIYPNGSLIISDVSSAHDQNFTVVKFDSLDEEPLQVVVTVVTIVNPVDSHPVIKRCGSDKTSCFQRLDSTSVVGCFCRKARPPVNLEWSVRTSSGDRNIQYVTNITRNATTYTSTVFAIDVFQYSQFLTLLVCKAQGYPGMLENEESLILLQNKKMDVSSLPSRKIYVALHSKLDLTCTNETFLFLTWQRTNYNNDEYEHISHTIRLAEQHVLVSVSPYELNEVGSLVVSRIEVEHEGFYFCAYGDGLADGTTTYQVIVYAHPDPSHPVVEGCGNQQFCVLNVSPEGNLTCSVSGILTKVSLEWTVQDEDALEIISFGPEELKVNGNGEKFSIKLTSHYQLLHSFQGKVVVKCQISGLQKDVFKEATRVELLIQKENGDANSAVPASLKILIGISVSLSCAAIVAFVVYKAIGRRRAFRTGSYNRKENIRLLQKEVETAKFISKLKERYGNVMYNAVHPIPGKGEKFYPVIKLFVTGGVEAYVISDENITKGVWKKRESFQDILKDKAITPMKYILEGEAGYGKSILTLQLVHDWCNNALYDKDVLIFLQLRKLSDTTSIFEAVKDFALPQDAQFSVPDIERILISVDSSVVLLMDGFDEYPHKDSDIDTDIHKIIRREILSHCTLILTTRPGYLPAEYLTQATQCRLTGFGRKAQEHYIKMAVADDIKAVNNTLRRSRAHRVLSDLWSIPKIFASLAQISHEGGQSQRMTCITTVVSYLILYLHSHARHKMKDNEVMDCERFEKCHELLDKVAFDAVFSSKKLVWSRDELCEKLGRSFYDYYIRTGILLEKHHSSNVAPSLGSDRTEVKFLDNIFCEWYAAHYLVHELKQQGKQKAKQQEDEERNEQEQCKHQESKQQESKQQESKQQESKQQEGKQKQVEPFRLIDTGDGKEKSLTLSTFQQVYRFACGLSNDAADTLIRHLKDNNAADIFIRLCHFEKEKDSKHFENAVRNICKSTISFRKEDSVLVHNSSAQILDLAASCEIPVSCVKLIDSYNSVNCAAGYILLESCVRLSSLSNIKTLWLDDGFLELKSEDFKELLKFSGSRVLGLQFLKFSGCLLPQFFKDKALGTLNKKKVTVSWDPFYTSSWCYLNFASGKWERGETPIDYQSVLSTWLKRYVV